MIRIASNLGEEKLGERHRASRKKPTMPADSWFRTCRLQNCNSQYYCCFKSSSVQLKFLEAALGNKHSSVMFSIGFLLLCSKCCRTRCLVTFQITVWHYNLYLWEVTFSCPLMKASVGSAAVYLGEQQWQHWDSRKNNLSHMGSNWKLCFSI